MRRTVSDALECGEWHPSKAEYLRVEQEVINLILKAHDQGRKLSGLAFWCVAGWAILIGHLVFGWFA